MKSKTFNEIQILQTTLKILLNSILIRNKGILLEAMLIDKLKFGNVKLKSLKKWWLKYVKS